MQKKGRFIIQWTYPLLVLLIGVLLFVLHVTHKEYVIRSYQVNTILNALDIVRAAEGYYSKTGGYPETLEILVPEYLPKVFNAYWGDSGWVYRAESDGFTLTVGYRSKDLDILNPSLEYDSKNKSWGSTDITELSLFH